MCGISGQINFKGIVHVQAIDAMNEAQKHRGPDDHGIYINQSGSTGLGHRRLSMIDLSSEGHQPLTNTDTELWITYNGEIYNYLELRTELENAGHRFHSQSDTEVILIGYKQWGTTVLTRLKGMFAFAIWDEQKKELFAARDRFGMKPFYYYFQDGNFVFASEIKGIKANPTVTTTLDHSSFADAFVYRYVPGPKSIWREVKKLAPAHYLLLKTDGSLHIQRYWDIPYAEKMLDDNAAVEKLDELLYNSIRQHNRSDVPVGAFLSGGYDSSSIVYYMKRFGYTPPTFSAGFDNWNDSEHQYADLVAKQFGTDHHSLMLDGGSMDILEHLAWVYDEPNADTSIIPTYLVSKETSKYVKTVMGGDGSDEILAGYAWQKDLMNSEPPKRSFFDFFKSSTPPVLSFYSKQMGIGKFDTAELKKLLHPDLHASIAPDPEWFYKELYKPQLPDLKAMQVLDIKHFMGEQVLAKTDRAAMANSLEVRLPFLDHEICEFVMGLSPDVYFRKNETKHLLYQNIKGHLPQQILDRKKQGFVGPEHFYSNIVWYHQNLSHCKLADDHIVNRDYIDDLLVQKDHWRLWKVAVMEFWYRKWAPSTNP